MKTSSIKISKRTTSLYKNRDRTRDRSDVPQLSPEQWFFRGVSGSSLPSPKSQISFLCGQRCPRLAEIKGTGTSEPDQRPSARADGPGTPLAPISCCAASQNYSASFAREEGRLVSEEPPSGCLCMFS